MNEHISPEKLSAYGDGALNQFERLRIEAHVERCAECAQVLKDFSRVSMLMRRGPGMAVPPFFATRVLAQIKARQKDESFFSGFVWIAKRVTPALAMLCAVLWLSTQWRAPQPPSVALRHVAADSMLVTNLLVQNGEALTTDDLLQLAFFNSTR